MITKLLVLSIFAALITAGLFVGMADPHEDEVKKLRHVVSFKFKKEASEEAITSVVDAFRDLQKTIPEIKAFEWGTNVSPEKHDKGFTHCFILTFDTAADRDHYLVHPDHKKFGQNLGPVLGDVFVLDYWVKQ